MVKSTSRHTHGRSELWDRRAVVEAVRLERKRLGTILRAIREKRTLTQEQAAEKAGLHPKHIVRIEGGLANVTRATLVALAAAYGTTLRDFFTDRGRRAR